MTDHFMVGVPFARAINPITKTNWEGTGVKPDVAVLAGEALHTAHLAALKKKLTKTTDDAEAADDLKAVIARIEKELETLRKGPTPRAGRE